MEKFFETRVAIPPYRSSALHGWARAFGAPPVALPSLAALMRADLAPAALAAPAPSPSPPIWQLQWALRIPPAAPQIVPAGHPAVLNAKNKILFFVSSHFNRIHYKLAPVYL